MWCSSCAKSVRTENFDSKICCSLCGRVLDEDNFSQEPTFVKNAAGQSTLSGNFVRTVHSEYSASRERTLNEAHDGMKDMMFAMDIDGGDSILNPSLRLYKIAVERNFTKGRRKELVQAACLYITCRIQQKHFLLIDFSEHLRINVYVLGAVFLQLCKRFSFEEHEFVQKPVDPSLFIHRFTSRLFDGSKLNVSSEEHKEVNRTALHIVASMKRDWMQTGRKPSGLCGAALYIAAISHGHKCSKSEIIKIVHVCESTLTKRLIEFENTESGALTIEEFNMQAMEFERLKSLDTGMEASGLGELLCEHKGTGVSHFAHGLCASCYKDFIKLSGGLDGGLEPPAFQRAEKERLAKEASVDSINQDSSTLPGLEHESELLNSNEQRSIKNMGEPKVTQPAESDLTGATLKNDVIHDSSDKGIHADAPLEESESLSDIDDIEVDFYLHSEEEKHLKKIIWEEMNKEYLEEQAAKEAAAKAAKEAYEAALANCSGDVKAAQELFAAAAASAANKRKERQQKRAAEEKNAGPPQTAAEATKRILDKKKLSSKIRYDVLEKLFDDSETLEITKKSRTEPKSDHKDDGYVINKEEENGVELEGTEDAYFDNPEEYGYYDDINQFEDDF